jgi:hypothetical protein
MAKIKPQEVHAWIEVAVAAVGLVVLLKSLKK